MHRIWLPTLVAHALILAGRWAAAGPEVPPLLPVADGSLIDHPAGDELATGVHWRFETERGPVHVWRPFAYNHNTAGVVVYVHGYYQSVDECFRDHALAEQFARSGRNALFIVPEAPVANEDPVRFDDLGALLDLVAAHTRQPIPGGPLVVAGHSGAIRTLRLWLRYNHIDEILLLDGLYAFEDELSAWWQAGEARGARLVLVACETMDRTVSFAASIPQSRYRADVPPDPALFDEEDLAARLLWMPAPEGHMEMITQGRVLPLLLRASRLVPL